MINRFLLFMKMFLTGVFEFIVGTAVFFVFIIGAVIIAEIIARVKILTIILLIILFGVMAFALFIIADDFWDDYKRERDFRGL